MKLHLTPFLLLAGFFLCGTTASAQWKLASGFSNSNASLPNDVDNVANFAVWGDSLVATAYCATDQLNFPGATPDSLFLSTDNGQTWTDLSPYGGIPFIVAGADFIGGTQPSLTDLNIADQVLSYSTNGGQSWAFDTTAWYNPGGNGMPSSLASIGSTVYMSIPFGVFHQMAGSQWIVDTVGLGVGNTISLGQVGGLIASGNSLFLSTDFSGIFLQKNGGSWSSVNNGLPSFTSGGVLQWWPAWYFATSGSSVYAIISTDTTNIGAIIYSTVDFYRTTNNGQQWNRMNSSSISNWGYVYALTGSSQDLFAGTDSGFYVSYDNAATWTQADQGLQLVPGDYPRCVQISGGNIVIGTNSSGAWYRKLSDFGGASVGSNTTNSLSLSESYPNPVSSTSKINYFLAKDGIASLTLFDVTGKQVAVLANGYQIAGHHTAAFDGSSLPAGMYFYRLTTADGSIGNWLQLIK